MVYRVCTTASRQAWLVRFAWNWVVGGSRTNRKRIEHLQQAEERAMALDNMVDRYVHGATRSCFLRQYELF